MAISDLKETYLQLKTALNSIETWAVNFGGSVDAYNATRTIEDDLYAANKEIMARTNANIALDTTLEAIQAGYASLEHFIDGQIEAAKEIPVMTIIGMANGTDFAGASLRYWQIQVLNKLKDMAFYANQAKILINRSIIAANEIENNKQELKANHKAETYLRRIEAADAFTAQMAEFADQVEAAAFLAEQLEGKRLAYEQMLGAVERLKQERLLTRQAIARRIQGFRTRNAGLRLFRQETLDRYTQLFEAAARYTFLAASAFDYETGLLRSKSGRQIFNRIIAARSLGAVVDGRPEVTGSNLGDPGLASILAELKANWTVLESRMGVNNPDTYGTTFSMRSERYRIYPDSVGDSAWQDVLLDAYTPNLLHDPDVRNLCMQIDDGSGMPVPGLLLEFSTRIEKGYNFFGQLLSPGDNTFSTASYANKILAAGIALEGYQGMSDILANVQVVNQTGGTSPVGGFNWLDPDALSATPYIYLIPVGEDVMRTPPLGDTSSTHRWTVQEHLLAMPFNLGQNPYNSARNFDSALDLDSSLINGNGDFPVRKHQPFRAVSTPDVFYQMSHVMDNYTNSRLVGRSVWNTRWKLVIPGETLLNNPEEGLERFIRTVSDIKLHLKTYSYTGN